MADLTRISDIKACAGVRTLYTIEGKDKTICNYVIIWRHVRTFSNQE